MTISTERQAFPCTACGKCCRLVGQSEETAWLDRGDGVCRHFDEPNNGCGIYAERPLVCQVEGYYDRYLRERFTWSEFVQINLDICARL